MAAVINIDNITVQPKTDIRVLGLQIDTKLKWGPHVRRTQEKMVKQSMALTRLSASTWGATFAKARQVYTMVVRPLLTYGSAIWHMPKDIKNVKTSTNKLSVMQNKCLRTVAGAFRATPVPILKTETYVASINIHLDRLQAKAQLCLRAGGQEKLIRNSCWTIANKLQARLDCQQTNQRLTPEMEKSAWAKKILAETVVTPALALTQPWEVATLEEKTP